MTPRLQKIRIDWNDDRLMALPGVAKAIKENPDITPDDIFETLVANDPTKTGKFVGWMLKAWENRDFQWEDIRAGRRSQINQTMRDFETFKRMKGSDKEFLIDEKHRSIMVHNGPQALWQFMMSIPELKAKMENDGPDTESNRHRKKMVSAKAHMEAWQKTYPSGLKVTVPFTLFASQFFGRNTKWCTTEDDGYNFSSYTNDGPLMIFTLPDGTRFQGHVNISEYSEYGGRIEDCDISFMNEADIPLNKEQKAKILEHASDFKEAFYEFSGSFLNGNESEAIFNEIMKRESGNRQAPEVASASNENTSEKVQEFTMEIPEDYMEVINGKHIVTTMPMNASSEFNIIVDYLYKNDVNFEQKLKSLITMGCSNHREKYGKQLFIGSVLDKTDFDFMKIDRMENVDNDADSFPSCGVRRNLAEIAADLPKKYLPRFGYNTIMSLDDDCILAKKIAMDINNDCFHPTEHLLSYVNDPQSGAWSQVRMLNRFMGLNPHTEMVDGNESEVILRHFPSLDLETILKKSMDGMHDPDFDDCDRPESVIKFLLGNGMSHTMLSRNAELNEFIRNCNRMTHPISGCNYPEATDYAKATIHSVISNFGVPVMTPEIRDFMKASPCNQYDEIMETYRAVCEMSFANIERSGRSLGLDEQTMASVMKHIRTNRNGYESEYVEPVVNRLTIFTDGRRRFPSDPEMS